MELNTYSGIFIDEKMYLFSDGRAVFMIDSVINQAADEYLEKLQPEQIFIILTHEHIDHIYGVNHYRERYNCKVICSETCGARIRDSRTNFARFQDIILGSQAELDTNYSCYADITFSGAWEWTCGIYHFMFYETPGHSPGSICIWLNSQYLFTGDTLLKHNPVITRFPGGDRRRYMEDTVPILKGFPISVQVFPGHGESGIMKEFEYEIE